MRGITRAVVLLLGVILFLYNAGDTDGASCPADFVTPITNCLVGFYLKYSTANTDAEKKVLCTEYFQAVSCVTTTLEPCPQAIKDYINGTFYSYQVVMNPICVDVTTTTKNPNVTSAVNVTTTTPNPACYTLSVYNKLVVCIGDLPNDLKLENRPTNLYELTQLCNKYYTAWSCSRGAIDPCPAAQEAYAEIMLEIVINMKPYCGEPPEAGESKQADPLALLPSWFIPVIVVGGLTVIAIIISVIVVVCKKTVFKKKTGGARRESGLPLCDTDSLGNIKESTLPFQSLEDKSVGAVANNEENSQNTVSSENNDTSDKSKDKTNKTSDNSSGSNDKVPNGGTEVDSKDVVTQQSVNSSFSQSKNPGQGHVTPSNIAMRFPYKRVEPLHNPENQFVEMELTPQDPTDQ